MLSAVSEPVVGIGTQAALRLWFELPSAIKNRVGAVGGEARREAPNTMRVVIGVASVDGPSKLEAAVDPNVVISGEEVVDQTAWQCSLDEIRERSRPPPSSANGHGVSRITTVAKIVLAASDTDVLVSFEEVRHSTAPQSRINAAGPEALAETPLADGMRLIKILGDRAARYSLGDTNIAGSFEEIGLGSTGQGGVDSISAKASVIVTKDGEVEVSNWAWRIVARHNRASACLSTGEESIPGPGEEVHQHDDSIKRDKI